MKRTVTLDVDVEQLLQRRMVERGITFQAALNEAVRESAEGAARRFRTATASMGQPTTSLDSALQLSAQLEDEDLDRKM